MKKLIQFLTMFAGWSNGSKSDHGQKTESPENSSSSNEESKSDDHQERPQEVPSDNYPMF